MAVTFLTNEDKLKIDQDISKLSGKKVDKPNGDGTAGQALFTNGDGSTYWGTIPNASDEISIPSYWKSAVTAAEGKINVLQSSGGADTFTFGFVTDTHTVSYAVGEFANLMEHVMNACHIPLFLHGGDFISGRGISSKEEHLKEIKNHDRIFKNIEDRCLLAMGNHDAVFGQDANYDSSLTDNEVYNYIFRKNEAKHGLVFGEPKTYFYKDIPAQKVRYIALNCYDYPTTVDENNKIISGSKMSDGKIGSTQLTWFAEEALKMPEGYSAVVCTHTPPFKSAEMPAGWSAHLGTMSDVEVLRGIVSSYCNRTSYTYNGTFGTGNLLDTYNLEFDFADYNGEIVCWVSGHTHMDKIVDLGDFPLVVTANCSNHVQTIDAPTKVTGTNTEYIMDFISINKNTRKGTVVRLGASLGANGGETVTYTNHVNTSDESYQDGYRINSVGETVQQNMYAISNYIPVGANDIIHMTGWRKFTNMLIYAFYDENKALLKIVQYTSDTAKGFGVPEYDSNVLCFDHTQVTASLASRVRYVRISGEVDTILPQVVTINENIKGTIVEPTEDRVFEY